MKYIICGAPQKHQVLEHQLLNNQLLKHQLSKTGVANLFKKWAKILIKNVQGAKY
jgi:hypothetical protein